MEVKVRAGYRALFQLGGGLPLIPSLVATGVTSNP